MQYTLGLNEKNFLFTETVRARILAKSAVKKLFSKKLNVGIRKNSKFDADFKSVGEVSIKLLKNGKTFLQLFHPIQNQYQILNYF